MKKISLIFGLLIFINLNVTSQDLRKKAEENPLDCAIYLFKKDKGGIKFDQLARTLFEVGRYDDAIAALEFEEHRQLDHFVIFTKNLIEKGYRTKADKFLSRISALLKNGEKDWDENILINLAPLLIDSRKSEEALLLAQSAQDDDKKVKIAVSVAKEFIKANQPENALKVLGDYYEIAETDRKAEIIELFARLQQKEKAEKLLAEFEPNAFIEEVYHNRRFILLPLINANLALGKVERAIELWQLYGETDDGYGYIEFIDALFEFGYRDKAIFYLNQITTDQNIIQDVGANIVERYLKLNETATATTIAKKISDDVDNYEQQRALMLIADKLILDGKDDSALEILNFAFQRAKKIVFEHEPMQSNGASSGTRKRNYLNQIYNRFVKLKNYQKAYETLMSIDDEHWIAKEFLAEHLIDFTKRQIKSLPREKIYAFLMKAQNISKDAEYLSIQTKLQTSEIYAQIGEKPKAVELITEVLEKAKESCCYKDDFLLAAGKVFEDNKLKSNPKLKRILKEIIADEED